MLYFMTHKKVQSWNCKLTLSLYKYELVYQLFCPSSYKQLLDEVFVISGISKVEVRLRLRLITLTETLIISDITKTESNDCFITHCFKENNDKRIIALNSLFSTSHVLTWTWHCSWKSCIAHATYGLFTNLLADQISE